MRLPARSIRTPTSVSEAAQRVLGGLLDERGLPRNAAYPLPEPDDRAGWETLKAAVDAQYRAGAETMAAHVGATVETLTIGEATVHVAMGEDGDGRRAYIDLHGGALVFGGGTPCRRGAQVQADRLGVCCYAIDYRMPPAHPFPAALDDCLTVYRHVLARHAPGEIVIGGRSAGGNLAGAMLLRARDEGLPMPAGLVLLSPEIDLTESGDTFGTNHLVDAILPQSLMNANLLYAGGRDLADPYLSPLFADLAGFPPTFLQSGTRDLFLSNTVRMHRALLRAGVAAELHVFEAMPHGGFMGQTPEDEELSMAVAEFIAARWPR